MRLSLRLAEVATVAALLATIVLAWRADRRDRAQLATRLAAAQLTVTQAASREKDRNAQLTQTLAQLAAERNSAVTPEQILKALPQVLGLPAPLSLQPAGGPPATNPGPRFSPAPASAANVGARFSASPSDQTTTQPTTAGQQGRLPDNPAPKPRSRLQDAVLPSTDLKPLYDFALDCQACQAKLTAAQADLADEKIKSTALAKQRDAALRAAKGGSALRRIARAAKWFLIGAAAGAIASKAAR